MTRPIPRRLRRRVVITTSAAWQPPTRPPGIMHDRVAREAALLRLDALSRVFDIAFIIPGTNVRFGIEAILRLVPGIGDIAASGLSCWLLYKAHRLGVPPRIFARMLVNIAIEGIVGAVPIAGDAFDVAFRANRRNVRLLRGWFDGRPGAF